MNLGITTSFIVGGLLLLSIMHMNFTVSNNSLQTTLQMTSKHHQQAVSETITADFQRMGYDVPQGEAILNSVSENKISFQANIDGTVRTVVWEFKSSSEYEGTSNPDDHQLVRTGVVSAGNVESITYPVVSFDLTYYDSQHNETITPNEVDQIKIEVVTESPVPVTNSNGNKSYGRSFWQRTIVPPSLHIRNLSE